MQAAGAAALELNVFLLPTDRHAGAQELEQAYADIVRKVAAAVTVPVSVKLPMRLTNVLSVGDALLARGARGVVLYNRFFEPDIDVEKMCFVAGDPFSEPSELRNVLRSTALCSHALPQLDVAVSTGVHDGEAAVKALLCGASAVQVCTAIHRYGYEAISRIGRFIDEWAGRQGFASLDELPRADGLRVAEGDHYQRVAVHEVLFPPRGGVDGFGTGAASSCSSGVGPGPVPDRFRSGRTWRGGRSAAERLRSVRYVFRYVRVRSGSVGYGSYPVPSVPSRSRPVPGPVPGVPGFPGGVPGSGSRPG